jgi:hypothetical protein
MMRLTQNTPRGFACLLLFVLLCVSVFAQMLGVPATLLDAAAAFDTLGGAVLEGLTVLPALVHLMPTTLTTRVVEAQPSAHCAVLAVVPFHPPV